jgi:hypothetical protein
MTGDTINACFHLGGGLSLWLNVYRLQRDKIVAGVWAPSTVFYTAFGLWNLAFYGVNGCPLSLVAASLSVSANLTWLFSARRYSKSI